MTATPNNPQYELLSSTRFDPFLSNVRWNDDADGPSAFLLLRYNFDRLIAAADRHNWDQAKSSINYSSFKETCQDAVVTDIEKYKEAQALKLRITLSRSGHLAVTTSPVTPFLSDPTSMSLFNPLQDDPCCFGSDSVFSIFLDPGVCPSSLFTSTKTTYRPHYNDARRRANLPPLTQDRVTAEVLLHNEKGQITEASISNVAIYRASHWLTPATATGCLTGVQRRWLLEQGRILEDKEGHLTKDSIKDGDWVLLFNGVWGCQLGRIMTGIYQE